MNFQNLLNKARRVFGASAKVGPPAPTGLGPVPGKVDTRRLLRSAQAGWPAMRGLYLRRPRRKAKVTFDKNGKRIGRRALRDAFIFESMRQGVRIAKARRAAYVARRSARWKKLVVANVPAMFAAELQKQGLGFLN